MKSLNRVRLLATPWTVAYQALPSMGFPRQEYWSGVPLPSPDTKYKNTNKLHSSLLSRPLIIYLERLRNQGSNCQHLLDHSLSCIGEGNGNPFQCSCLEDPRDGGAWWATDYGVAQSRTRLKRLSSSSSRDGKTIPEKHLLLLH